MSRTDCYRLKLRVVRFRISKDTDEKIHKIGLAFLGEKVYAYVTEEVWKRFQV